MIILPDYRYGDGSELHSIPQLQRPIVLRPADRAADDDVHSIFREIEIRVVRQVERLQAKLQRHRFLESDPPPQRRIDGDRARTVQNVAPRRAESVGTE